MRYLVGFVLVLGLGAAGCGEDPYDPCAGVRCGDGNECTNDECVDGSCEFSPVEGETECNDGNECTVADSCAAGACAGVPVEDSTACSSDFNACTDDMCVGGACENIPVDDARLCNNRDGNECTGVCADGICAAIHLKDGTACGAGEGECRGGICDAVEGTFPCTEEGIREAVALGGGPFTFDCDGAQTVTTEAEIVVGRSVILDGEGKLTISGGNHHRVFSVGGRTVTLSGMAITEGYVAGGNGGAISLSGTVTLHHCTISGNTARNSSGVVRGHGGGIYSRGTLQLNASTVSDNRAYGYCIPDCTWFCCSGGSGDDIANEGGTVILINSVAERLASWSDGTVKEIGSALLCRPGECDAGALEVQP